MYRIWHLYIVKILFQDQLNWLTESLSENLRARAHLTLSQSQLAWAVRAADQDDDDDEIMVKERNISLIKGVKTGASREQPLVGVTAALPAYATASAGCWWRQTCWRTRAKTISQAELAGRAGQ